MRRHRNDFPGALFHVYNRAVDGRPIFESSADIALLLEELQALVDEGLIVVHCFCILTTHFHLLITSPVGKLRIAMLRLQACFARFYNKTRERTGVLFGSRYKAKLVKHTRYRDVLIVYIDWNAVDAGLARLPADYPHGSAYHFHRPPGPTWLSRTLVEESTAARWGTPFDPARYGTAGDSRLSEGLKRTVGRILASGAEPPPLDDLFGAAPGRVQVQLVERAKTADGGSAGRLILDPATIHSVIESMRATAADSPIPAGAPDWTRMEAGLLYHEAGQTVHQIAVITHLHDSTAHRRVGEHRRALIDNPVYSLRCAEAVCAGLDIDYGSLRRRV